jgi:hypothetical protein
VISINILYRKINMWRDFFIVYRVFRKSSLIQRRLVKQVFQLMCLLLLAQAMLHSEVLGARIFCVRFSIIRGPVWYTSDFR